MPTKPPRARPLDDRTLMTPHLSFESPPDAAARPSGDGVFQAWTLFSGRQAHARALPTVLRYALRKLLLSARRFLIRTVKQLRQREFDLALDTDKPCKNFQDRSNAHKDQLNSLVKKLRKEGKRIHVYGASTKGNAILQWCGIDNRIIDVAAERNPDKYGAHTLGTDIMIVSEGRVEGHEAGLLSGSTLAFQGRVPSLSSCCQRHRSWGYLSYAVVLIQFLRSYMRAMRGSALLRRILPGRGDRTPKVVQAKPKPVRKEKETYGFTDLKTEAGLLWPWNYEVSARLAGCSLEAT